MSGRIARTYNGTVSDSHVFLHDKTALALFSPSVPHVVQYLSDILDSKIINLWRQFNYKWVVLFPRHHLPFTHTCRVGQIQRTRLARLLGLACGPRTVILPQAREWAPVARALPANTLLHLHHLRQQSKILHLQCRYDMLAALTVTWC